ncbi:MAG: CDP-diacylglycerol--glycerol-3-phosphate 3-phosphatidyltransferase [Gammaproteobacteria bacterium]|jgi:CDP-diacylglycerol--glycerol-3-phosphate 3-phosphatidyltransferase|nr:CDP-diacylglycerol--glycerol-3-phosphate 3-phosphatidyltransferase [Gammaproteobacteria bacterium]
MTSRPPSLPNLLTLLRILLVPVFLAVDFLASPGWAGPLAATVFALAAVTDGLDGALARRWGSTSRFGAVVDPIADKLMVTAALLLLLLRQPTFLLFFAALVIVSRELIIAGLREWMAGAGASGTVRVSLLAKVKTAVQMVALVTLLAHPGPFLDRVGIALLYVSVVLTLWSGMSYLLASWMFLRHGFHGKKSV